MAVHLLDLPNEILCKIFEYLLSSKEKLNARQVCRRWRDSIDENVPFYIFIYDSNYEKIQKKYGTRLVDELYVKHCSKPDIKLRSFRFLRKLVIGFEVGHSTTRSLLTNARHLKELHIDIAADSEETTVQNDRHLETLFSYQHHLQKLFLLLSSHSFPDGGFRISIIYPILRNCSHCLHYIHLEINPRLNKQIDLQIFAVLKSLEVFHLKCYWKEDKIVPFANNLSSLISTNTLKHLCIEGFEIDTHDVRNTIKNISARDPSKFKVSCRCDSLGWIRSVWDDFEERLREMGFCGQVEVCKYWLPNTNVPRASKYGIVIQFISLYECKHT